MKTILLLFAALPMFGQQQVSYIATTGNVALNPGTTAATLQQPATNQQPVGFPAIPGVGASVYCSVACVATISVFGGAAGAATATAGTVAAVGPTFTIPASVLFFTASNASGETTVAVLNIQPGQTFPIDLSAVTLPKQSGARITISIASITGTANITFYPVETK